MNLFFIIGGIIVLAGITVMTIYYFKTASELEEAKTELSRKDMELKEAEKAYDALWRAVMDPIQDADEVKFGGF